MSDSPSLVLAFAAGLVSFVSPCVLPLVPGYLAAVTGRDPRVPGQATRRTNAAVRSLVFIATFSAVFVALGLSATALGALLFDHRPTLNRVAGVVIVGMGLLFVAAALAPRLSRQWQSARLLERAGRGGPVIAGLAFALAWTPCVGPTLGAILGLASTSAGTGRGGLLLGIYSAGLAVPFLFSALAFDAAQRSFAFFRRHHAVIQAGAGVVLVIMGVLVFTGELFRLNVEAQRLLDSLGINFFSEV